MLSPEPVLCTLRGVFGVIILLEYNQFVVGEFVLEAAKKQLFKTLAALLCVYSAVDAMKLTRAISEMQPQSIKHLHPCFTLFLPLLLAYSSTVTLQQYHLLSELKCYLLTHQITIQASAF